jgi:hypothetical protein
VNVTKAKLETLFTDELTRLQPTPSYMRLLKESVLGIWKARQASVRADLAQAQRTADAIQQKLDRLDEAFRTAARGTHPGTDRQTLHRTR